jgi:hypothetical protein
MDPDLDPDPAIFVIGLQDANKKQKRILKKGFLFIRYVFKLHLNHFQRKKVQTKSKNSRNQGFLIIFDERRIRIRSWAESVPLTNRSGSGRPKNMWIRIRNIVFYDLFYDPWLNN